tara:strand:+ start:245 stop:736 length:492 start_codon:yes stop_codon:yes gene_type:complete
MSRYIDLKPFNRIAKKESILFNFFSRTECICGVICTLALTIWDNGESDHSSILYICAVNAVMAFFVLSGYFITTSIYRNASELQFKDFHFIPFAKDKLIRLYPPLVFSFIIVFLVYMLGTSSTFSIKIISTVTSAILIIFISYKSSNLTEDKTGLILAFNKFK